MKSRFTRFVRAALGGLALCLLPAISQAVGISLTYGTPQQAPAPASPEFGIAIWTNTCWDAYGNTAEDYIASYKVERQNTRLYQSSTPPNSLNYYFRDPDSLGAGVYAYVVYVDGDRPEAYDRWIDGYDEDEIDENGEVTGWHHVDGHRDVGIEWFTGTIGAERIQFILGDATPVIVSSPQSATANVGAVATFSVVASGSGVWVDWQRLPAGGSTWTSYWSGFESWVTALPNQTPGSVLNVRVAGTWMNGDQFRAVVINPAGSVTSASATLTVTVPHVIFSGGDAIAVSYLAPQQSAGPTNAEFSMVFSGNTTSYTAADGSTASDQLSGYTIGRPTGAPQTYSLNYTNYDSAAGVYRASYRDLVPLTLGVYTYWAGLQAWHPEPFDRWVEAHDEDEIDENGNVTGWHHVDAHWEIGFDWSYQIIASVAVPFYVGVAPGAPLNPPSVVVQPTPKTVVFSGGTLTAAFSCSFASELMADLKWQRSSAGGAWADIGQGGDYAVVSANNRSTLTVTVHGTEVNGDQFRCVASNAAGSVTSNSAVLNVYTIPIFSSQPLDGAGIVNTTINVSFTATATGVPAPTYQWQQLVQGSWVDLANAGTPTFTYNGYYSGSYLFFRCIASNAAGAAISRVAALQPLVPPSFAGGQPESKTISALRSDWPVMTYFTASASGTPAPTLQWQRRNPDYTWSNLTNSGIYSGVTSVWLYVSGTAATVGVENVYRCVASNSAGSTASQTAYLYIPVPSPFYIATQPHSQTVLPGGSTNFTVAAVGEPAPTYWWQQWDGAGWRDYWYTRPDASHYSGITTNTLTVSNVETGMSGRFRCWITSGSRTLTSEEVTLTVDSTAPRSSQTINFPAIANQTTNSPSFMLNATATSGLPITYSIDQGPVSLTGSTVTILGPGTVTVRASQAGNATFFPAPDAWRTFSIDTLAAGAPHAQRATNVSSSGFLANWSPVSGATGYRLDVATQSDFNPDSLIVANRLVTGIASEVSTINAYRTYYYRVRAETSSGLSAYSNTITVNQYAAAQAAPPDSELKDLDGDGVPDEIIPSGDNHKFFYYISYAWPVGGTVTFDDLDFGVNDYWAYGSNSDDSRTDVFNPYWHGSYSISYNLGVHARVSVEFVPNTVIGEQGYDYAIYSTTNNATSTGLDLVMDTHWFHDLKGPDPYIVDPMFPEWSLDELYNMSFRLVRMGKPVKDAQINIGGMPLTVGVAGGVLGAIGVPIPGVPGGASVNIGKGGGTGTVTVGGTTAVITGTGVSVGGGSTVSTGPIQIGPLSGEVDSTGVTIKVDPNGEILGTTVRVNRDGSGSITLSNGAGISVDANGKVGVQLPKGTPSGIIKVVDAIGTVLQAGRGAGISVKDIQGIFGVPNTPIALPGGDLGQVDGRLKPDGTFQVGIKINDTTTIWFDVTSPKPQIAVDANRDGVIAFDGTDATSADKPYRFWINDDIDRYAADGSYGQLEVDDFDPSDPTTNIVATNGWVEDWRSNQITSLRDLEDFSRMWVNLSGVTDAVRNGQLYVGLRWANTTGDPWIKLYPHVEADGGTKYLFDATPAGVPLTQYSTTNAIFNLRYGATVNNTLVASVSGTFVFPTSVFANLTESSPVTHLLFEGCSAGTGELKLVLLQKSGSDYTEIAQGGSVWFDLKEPKDFIQRWSSGDGDRAVPQQWQRLNANSGTFAPPATDAEKDLVLYVHGYNMTGGASLTGDKQRWIETTYKRLYWLGYKGRVAGFSWPCAIQHNFNIFTDPLADHHGFDDSEMRAWQSGTYLMQLLSSLKIAGYRVHMLAHSQGNVVAGEALRLWKSLGNTTPLVSTYIASQGAIPAHCYDVTVPNRTDFTPSAPNVYGHYWTSVDSATLPALWSTSNPSYLSTNYVQITPPTTPPTTFANFYNPDDYALTGNGFIGGEHPGWMVDQRLKPDTTYGYTTNDGFLPGPLRFPDDHYEIFSYGASAYSRALGSISTGGVFNQNAVDLKASYGFSVEHLWHSGQFRSYNAARWPYWAQLLRVAGIQPITP